VDGVRARDWATVDLYAVLGVSPAATSDEIGVAFRALAKRLHPDRVGASASDSERFKSVTAAYDVLGDERLRRSYDAVRVDAARQFPSVATIARPQTVQTDPVRERAVPLSPEVVRRRARRWIAAGVSVSLVGLAVGALIVHLQVGERARRAGRVKTDAVVLVSGARTDVRFTTSGGSVVRVPEPDRVNPGTQHDGQRVAVLYRPDRPTDVILDESTTARDITLWVVAVKLLVGGLVFLVVGIRRLR
jgi:hypothetical protein